MSEDAAAPEPTIATERYCWAFETWMRVVKADVEDPQELWRDVQFAEPALTRALRHLRATLPGVHPVRRLCDELEALADASHDGRLARMLLGVPIRKSCLLARLVYGGEPLRTRPCPLHEGRWSGAFQVCPHGCNYGANLTGWLPEPRDPT